MYYSIICKQENSDIKQIRRLKQTRRKYNNKGVNNK
nr:MAG TPA: hypothetical protein [Caudoviricetes sp.]